MRILLAPDKFKGSLTAAEACDAMRAGIARVDPKIRVDACPVSDGGEGFVDALVRAAGGRFVTRTVTGPLPEMKVRATFGLLPGATASDRPRAAIEMAAAAGLHLLRPDQYDVMAATTFGVGELIRAAVVEHGCRAILLGLGGSATCDGGVGCAQACGLPVLLDGGEPTHLTEPLCGRDVERVVLVKHGRGEVTEGVTITAACDVTNPLAGPDGAARVFAPQKGATPDEIDRLDRALARLAKRCGAEDDAAQPGSGAAGGLGFALRAFFGAALTPGAALVLDALRFDERLRGADLCVTGEGRLDATSLNGKAAVAVARRCKARGVPCVALAGAVDVDAAALAREGVTSARSIAGASTSAEESMRDARVLLQRAAERAVREFLG